MRRIGLVLGAGGVVGQAYHAGVLSALADATGWDPRTAELVVGTSAGSITAALLRAGVGTDDLTTGQYRQAQQRAGDPGDGEAAAATAVAAAAAAGSAATLTTGLRRPGRARMGGRLASVVPPGSVSPGGIISMVRQVTGDDWPERPTWVCAVRRGDGRRVPFGHEGFDRPPLSLAVAASCAIPGWFQPVLIDGREFLDGGAHSPTNLDLATGLGLDAVVVVSPMSTSTTTAARLDLPARLLFRATLARETFAVRMRGTQVLALQPGVADLEVMGLNAMDPTRWDDVVQAARQSTLRRLRHPRLRRVITGED